MKTPTSFSLGIVLCGLLAFTSHADDRPLIQQQSADVTVAVLELYTSEGCNNCPAAERYLKEMTQQYQHKHQFIPLAFHVDYWDYIGWEDPFSHPLHGERQRKIAMRNRLNSLYTPQFVLYGRDFPAYNNIPAAIAIVNDIKPRVGIDVQIRTAQPRVLDMTVNIEARDERARWYADVYVAIAEDNLSSQVTDGENEGLNLHHDHVVRRFLGPYAVEGKDRLEFSETLTLDPQWKLADLSLVVFAQDRVDGTTHQALSVPLSGLQSR